MMLYELDDVEERVLLGVGGVMTRNTETEILISDEEATIIPDVCKMTRLVCERCFKKQRLGSRRFRCGGCSRLVCRGCSVSGGHGSGQGSVRWHSCFDCEDERGAR